MSLSFVNNFNILCLMKTNQTESQLYTERVYIDPERLLQLKRERKPFKQVPSIFQPPPEFDNTQHSSTLSNPKLSLPSTTFKQQQISHQEIVSKNASPNVDFVVSLMGDIKSQQVIWYEEGDCIGVRQEDRCLILQGLVKVTGVGGRTFMLGQGSILFIHSETIAKVKQILCVKASRVLRLPEKMFPALQNYIFLKNAQKIKYLKYCPFFTWADSLTQDLASCMTMKVFDPGHYIYTRGDQSEQIMFVKEGVVLLERSVLLNSQVMNEYETHYERSDISTSETTLIVKKGMVFGVDGILLKDVSNRPKSVSKQIDNPQNRFERRVKPTTRVYTARTLGRTEVYVLQRQLLQGLFDVADLLSERNFQKELTKEDLQRICSDYTEMVVKKHRSLPKFTQAVISKQMTFQPSEQQVQELLQKKTKVKMVRKYQQNVKKNSIANIIADSKHYCKREEKDVLNNHSIVLQQHYSQRLGISQAAEHAGLAFPRLSSSLKKKRGVKKYPREESTERYIIGWVKYDNPKAKPKSVDKKSQKVPSERLKLINVKSYRSIIQPFI